MRMMFLFCSHGVKQRHSVHPRGLPIFHNAQPQDERSGLSSRTTGHLKTVAGTKAVSGTCPMFEGVDRMGRVESKRPVVLIVEDEILLRMDAVDMVGAAGFEVIEAGNADEAIEILETRPDITVVFTDIQIPGSMDGLKLARAIRGRWPPIKIIATSGRLNVEEIDLPEGGRFLPKPYGLREIAGVLRELTDG
jgi:CheY-like chemotaxis protein